MRSRSIFWSFDYAIQGIVHALRTQRNMRLHALAASVVLLAALFFRVRGVELAILLFAISLVVVTELANTAIEAAVDVAIDTFDPMAKVAKDVAAGAVLIASVNAVAVGYIVFFARLTPITQRFIEAAPASPASLTIIALALTGIAVLVLKAITHERNTTYLRGGWPSGHTALAVVLATSIGYATQSAKAMILAMFIAALVGQSRVETDAHSIPQTVLGALLGFLLTTAVFQVF
ncbi:MAG: diacylglycerol kinase [Coriobacteriia bacterium]|nr:diacylglycerol kinase [Coriobacteriia bacterium]